MPFFTKHMQDVPVPVITDCSLTALVSRKPVWDYCYCSPTSIMTFGFVCCPRSLSESAESREIGLLHPVKPWIQWGLHCLIKIFRWASSQQNILYRYLQSKETEEVSETPWNWWTFTKQDPDCAIATKKEEPKEVMNRSLTILKFIHVLHQRQSFLGLFFILQHFWFYIC